MENTFLDFPIFMLPDDAAGPADVRGEGKKHVLLIIEKTEDHQQDLAFAEKVIQAVGLSLSTDVFVLLKTPEQAVRLSDLAARLPATRILVFGPQPEQLGLYFRHAKYQVIRLGNRAFAFADSLAALRAERARGEKKLALRLWQTMKELFPENQRT